MAELDLTAIAAASINTPASGVFAAFAESTNPAKRLSSKDDAGTVVNYVGQATTDTLTNKTLTSPVINTATGSGGTFTGLVLSSGATSGIGYATGAGAAVTQATSRSTGVTINNICGQITGNSTSLAAGAEAIFTVTNSTVGLQDSVILSIQSGPTANTSVFFVSTIAAGSFQIRIRNLHATVADTGVPILNFAVIKAVKA